MTKSTTLAPNTLFVEVSGSGLPEVDGLYVPSTAPPAKSESGTVSSPGYWNGKHAWDRADGKSARSPAISYSNSYRSWRISRLDGHLAYEITCDDELPPTDTPWNVYKMGVAPAPKVTLYECVEIDTSKDCPTAYEQVRAQLAEHTDAERMARRLGEKAEILLGLRPYPSQA